MKKCPVCGVMMGDNVARCFMCKYDFQKAAREGEDAARQEANENIKRNEQEAATRVEQKRSDEEKVIVEMKARNQREIETLNQQLESEKLRIESKYVEIRKRALDERKQLEKELEELRESVEIEKKRSKDAGAERRSNHDSPA